MPSKRRILSTLADDELRELADIFELADAHDPSREGVLDRLVRARRAELEGILGCMPRHRLVQACDALGIEVGRAHNDTLVWRLMGRQAPLAGPEPPTENAGARLEPNVAASGEEPHEPVTGYDAGSEQPATYVEECPDGTCRTHTRLKHLTIIRALRPPAADSA